MTDSQTQRKATRCFYFSKIVKSNIRIVICSTGEAWEIKQDVLPSDGARQSSGALRCENMCSYLSCFWMICIQLIECSAQPFPSMASFKCGWILSFFTLFAYISMQEEKSSVAWFIRMSPKSWNKNKCNKQLPCQTAGRNGFSLPRALWQVHCGRIDSYIGGKWIVITCLFLMTLGWVPSDLLQSFELAKQLTLQISGGEVISLLFTGQELSHSEVTHQSSRVWDVWSWAAKCTRDRCLLSRLRAYSNVTRRTGRWRGKKGGE